MQVCVPTTPAQIFHLLRRQVIRPLRKPLVVMSPKSLLRHKEAISSLDDLANGHFQMVLPDQGNLEAKRVKRVVMCAGKVYYDLAAWREENACEDTAIVRIEQLYPSRRKSSSRRSRSTTTSRPWCGVRRSRSTRVPGTRASITCVPWPTCSRAAWAAA